MYMLHLFDDYESHKIQISAFFTFESNLFMK